MKTCGSIEEMTVYSHKVHASGMKLGLVPTMGALHEGHLSLVRKSVLEMEKTAVSIFVNPAQFSPGEDFDKYPRDFEGDFAKLEEAGADCVFLPTPEMMYPEGYATYVTQEKLEGVLCGRSRPGHFRGVLTVVLKLFNIVMPRRAYFGQKDYQQSVIIRRMTGDLNVPVEIAVLPIVREEDGLAMSSRNRNLSTPERKNAVCLYRALVKGKELIEDGEKDVKTVTEEMKGIIDAVPGVEIDYISVVDPDSLRNVSEMASTAVLAGAVRVGSTRIIDNIIVAGNS